MCGRRGVSSLGLDGVCSSPLVVPGLGVHVLVVPRDLKQKIHPGVDWLPGGLGAGKGACDDVVPPGNVANICRKLPDVVQVVELARGPV